MSLFFNLIFFFFCEYKWLDYFQKVYILITNLAIYKKQSYKKKKYKKIFIKDYDLLFHLKFMVKKH